jgi:hypothetical protein
MQHHYIKNQRNNLNLYHEGFIYNRDKQDENGMRWICLKRTCKESLHLDKNEILNISCSKLSI